MLTYLSENDKIEFENWSDALYPKVDFSGTLHNEKHLCDSVEVVST